MPKICYTPKTFTTDVKAIINKANEILESYSAQGYDLTLRQLYYQFVARGLLQNQDKNYKRLGSIVNDARLAGLIDWDHITDRTRNLRTLSHWENPQDVIKSAYLAYRTDRWKNQPAYVEVWVEKDALVGILETACTPLDVPYFSCRGYTSQSEMWSASQRLLSQGKPVHIIHLGDHDPSGVDMSRDIEDRLTLFMNHHGLCDYIKSIPRSEGETEKAYEERLWATWKNEPAPVTVNRVALTWDQIREYNPPPNPAKLTDVRATKYIEAYGTESWELDALEPTVITQIITDAVTELMDPAQWEADAAAEDAAKTGLRLCAAKWPAVEAYLKRGEKP